MRRYESAGEVEACLRRSLALDGSLFESADLLACELLNVERYEEAVAVLEAVAPRMPDPSPARGRQAWITRRQGRSEDAVRDLVVAVEDAPWYEWGWDVLMTWLEEDQSWVLARRLLQSVPDQMSTNVRFRQRRLVLLGKAGVDRTVLDAEWEELQRNFPDDTSVQAAKAEYDGASASTERAVTAGTVARDIPWWIWWLAGMAAFQLARSCQ